MRDFIYQYIQPSPHLKSWIKDFCVFAFELSTSATIPFKPYSACPEEGVTFYLRGKLTSRNHLTDSSEERPRAVFFGVPTYRQDLYLTNTYFMVNVGFQPGMLFKMFKIPMYNFTGKNIDAEQVLGNEIKYLYDELANTHHYVDVVHKLEKFFWRKINSNGGILQPIDNIPKFILANPTSFSLSKMASEACLSPSQFERRFVNQMGITPKLFARICRFTKAIKLKEQHPHLKWLDIAWDLNYSDYQHLVKDFRQFAGSLPNSLIEENKNTPEGWLGLI